MFGNFVVESAQAGAGTGAFALNGSAANTPYISMITARGNGSKWVYLAESTITKRWAIYTGVVTAGSPNTLSRVTVQESWDGVTRGTAEINWTSNDGVLRIIGIIAAQVIDGVISWHRGASAPAWAVPGTIWIDDSAVPSLVFKQMKADGATWATLFTFNESTGAWTLAATAFTGAVTMSSTLTLSANPASALQASTKQYVDRGDRQSIWGLTYANGSDATNDIDIAAGGAMDSTGVYWLALSAITKRLDAAWAVGTNQGGLDTGSIANTDYYIWAIARSDTGVTDVLFSTSATSPTMPANYDYKRLIGWFKRSGGSILSFTTLELAGGGLLFKWATPTLDKDVSNLGTSRITDAIRGPLNFRTKALIRALVASTAGGIYALVCDPGETDAAPSASSTPLATHATAGANLSDAKDMAIFTSATGTIAARANTANTVYRFSTLGFEWSRR